MADQPEETAPSETEVAALVEEHAATVWRFACGVLDDEAGARAVTVEVFRQVRDVELVTAPPPDRAALLAACRQVCHAWLADAGNAEAGGGEVARPDGLAGLLAASLAELPPEEREVVVLRDVLGLEADEAAEICGAGSATVWSRRCRAHSHLTAQVAGGVA